MGGYILNTTIQQNTIYNTTWAGMTIGWGWGTHPLPIPTHGYNKILYNDVQFVNTLTAGGYMRARVRGNADCNLPGPSAVTGARHHHCCKCAPVSASPPNLMFLLLPPSHQPSPYSCSSPTQTAARST